jgi:hypothetical protein
MKIWKTITPNHSASFIVLKHLLLFLNVLLYVLMFMMTLNSKLFYVLMFKMTLDFTPYGMQKCFAKTWGACKLWGLMVWNMGVCNISWHNLFCVNIRAMNNHNLLGI